MSMTFTTRRKLQRIGIVSLALLMVGILIWFCWVIWLERYVVYTEEGASLKFDLEDPGQGQLATPPNAEETISIYYNEGEAAIDADWDLKQLNGYYIDTATLREGVAGTRDMLATLTSGSAVMIELKSIKGSFYYSSSLSDAVMASNMDVTGIDSLIQDMNSRNLYTIACVPAFRDWNYGLNHVSSGLATLTSGSAVMIELKSIKGSFYYSSSLSDAVMASNMDVTGIDSLIQDMNSRNLYTIACVPAFRDWNYGLNHVSSGLAVPKKGYLWVDQEGCYWLDPTDGGTMSWLYSIVNELRGLGFDEVVFTDFRFPETNNIAFDGDRNEALATAAQKLVTTCAKDNFAVSFATTDISFSLPEGRSRMYLQNVGAKDVVSIVDQVQVTDPLINLVFMVSSNDTRFNDYSVLRPILTAQDAQRE